MSTTLGSIEIEGGLPVIFYFSKTLFSIITGKKLL